MNAKSFSTLIALGLLASACGTENRGLESVHQPVVQRSDFVLDLQTSYDGLAAGETRRLSGWFDSLQLGYGDHISIDDPSGDGGGVARQAVGAIAAHYGLLLDRQAPVTQGAIAPGSVRVVVSRMKASVPNCPDWSRSADHNFDNHSMSNFGCAVNSNLAAMVADPQDLVRGRDSSAPADAATAGKAIKGYRDKPTAATGDLKAESTGGDK